MPETRPESVNEYISAQPESVGILLTAVRNAIRIAVPEADEVFSYKMPGYKLNGSPLLYFAAWKQHLSLYPATSRLTLAFRDRLGTGEVSKSTIRFPLADPPDVSLIAALATFRATEIQEQARVRSVAKSAKRSTR